MCIRDRCKKRSIKLKLKIIGDGKFRSQLEGQAAQLGVNNSVKFLGKLPSGESVRDELLKADLFVLASHGEGLPRSMIEAMACSLPCIGSNASGIPELLHGDDLVAPGDAQALADKIEGIITNPERMRLMAQRNYKKSLEYKSDILMERRKKFYKVLRKRTGEWLEDKD